MKIRITKQHLALVIAAVAICTIPIRADVIVYDPTNWAVNFEQAIQHLEVIARLEDQIENQRRMLENWAFTQLEELRASMERIRGSLEAIADIDFDGQYSIDSGTYAGRDADAIANLRDEWLESSRAALVLARTVQSTVVAEIPGTQDRIGEYVEQSTEAEGQTAVLQASNETLGTLVAQIQNLQAIELADIRLELEEEARKQAEAAFHRQRREWLMRDWTADRIERRSPVRAISPPFTNR